MHGVARTLCMPGPRAMVNRDIFDVGRVEWTRVDASHESAA